jgi:hypothetical protein
MERMKKGRGKEGLPTLTADMFGGKRQEGAPMSYQEAEGVQTIPGYMDRRGERDSALRKAYDTATGISNKKRAADALARREGSGDAVPPTVSIPGTPVSGSAEDIAVTAANRPTPTTKEDASKGDEDVKSAVEKLAEQVGNIVKALTGLPKSDDVASVTTAVQKLGTDGIKADVSGSVEVSNIEALGTAAGTAAATAGGADIAEANLRLNVLEGFVDDTSTKEVKTSLETHITAAAAETDAKLAAAKIEITDAATVAASAATVTQIASLTAELAELRVVKADLDATKEDQGLVLTNLNTQIGETESKLADAVKKAEDAAAAAASAEESIGDVDDRLTTAEDDSKEAKTAATAAEAAATAATEAVGTATTKVDTLEAGIGSRTATVDGRLSTVDAHVVRIDGVTTRQGVTLGKQDARISNADQKARDAMNEARKK